MLQPSDVLLLTAMGLVEELGVLIDAPVQVEGVGGAVGRGRESLLLNLGVGGVELCLKALDGLLGGALPRQSRRQFAKKYFAVFLEVLEFLLSVGELGGLGDGISPLGCPAPALGGGSSLDDGSEFFSSRRGL